MRDADRTVDVRAYGPSALLVEVADSAVARELAAWVATRIASVDVVPAARTVLIDGVDPAAASEVLRDFVPGAEQRDAAGALAPATVTVPVRYDGPDLERVAELWDVDVDEVVRRHTSAELTSAFCGFSPGFAYLEGLPSAWAVPRLASPRPRVPAGAVALADTWSAVYPTCSPGGWLLLGTTDLPVWDLSRPGSPALLAPGTRVRFEAS